MDFYDSQYFKTNKRLLQVCGLWPDQSCLKSTSNYVIFTITTVSMALAMVTGIYSQANFELSSIVEAALAISYCSGGLASYIILHSNRHEIKKRTELMADDWKKLADDSERKIMGAFYLEARNAMNVTLGFGTPVYVLFIGCTFLPRMFSKKSLQQCIRSFPYYFKLIVINENTCHLQVCAHFSLAILFSTFAFLTISSTYMISVKHICALYGIASHRLRNAVLVDSKNIDPLKKSIEDTSIIPSFIKVINIHKEALRSIQYIERHYSIGFLFLEIGALVLLAILVFEINYHRGNFSELLRFLPMLLIFTTYVFFMNWCGEQVIQSCDDLRISAYNIDWYRISSRIRIFILMIMQMTARPVNLTAGNIMLLSLQNFSKILKTAWSFGMLLLTMQKPGTNKDANFLEYY